MPDLLFFVLVLVAILVGYFFGRSDTKGKWEGQPGAPVSRDFYRGLNRLLDDRADEAIELLSGILDVNAETVDTYLAFGSHFAKKGEVDKSIRVHQDLLARPSLLPEQLARVRLALAQDYMVAGLLDRAESLLLAQKDNYAGICETEVLKPLLKIYEREKEWERAAEVAERLKKIGNSIMVCRLAHFYCELAEECLQRDDCQAARKLIRQAQNSNRKCVRASILLGKIALEEGRAKEAVRVLQRVAEQDIRFVPLTLSLLEKAYAQTGNEIKLHHYLLGCLNGLASPSLLLLVTKQLAAYRSEAEAVAFLGSRLRRHPSLSGLVALIELQGKLKSADSEGDLQLLADVVRAMLAGRPNCRCENCGFSTLGMYWLCPGCQEWDTLCPVTGVELGLS